MEWDPSAGDIEHQPLVMRYPGVADDELYLHQRCALQRILEIVMRAEGAGRL